MLNIVYIDNWYAFGLQSNPNKSIEKPLVPGYKVLPSLKYYTWIN